MKSKYVIVEWDGAEIPLVFSRFLSHENVAMFVSGKIQSAGFCELDSTGRWAAGGHSLSLKLNARPQDAAILNEQLGPVFLPVNRSGKSSPKNTEINA